MIQFISSTFLFYFIQRKSKLLSNLNAIGFLGLFFVFSLLASSQLGSAPVQNEQGFPGDMKEDNWIPINAGLDFEFKLKDFIIFQDKYTAALDSKTKGIAKSGIYQWNQDSQTWIQIAPPVTKYGTPNLFVSFTKERSFF
ncbi:MAG: hypothetical protein MH321_02940 [Leptospiraceae bacterium]|nr:hypothetical protein [Leptospiraceae bacterium]